MVGNPPNRRSPSPWPFVLVGIVAAIVVVVGVGPPGELLARATVCQLGPEIGTYVVLTPLELMNKPFETNVSVASYYNTFNYTFASGSLVVGALPETSSASMGAAGSYGVEGGLDTQYQDHNWTFFRAVNASVIGTTSSPCTQPFVAELGAGLGCGGWQTIPLWPNNSTDTNEPHVLNGIDNITGSQGLGCPVATPGTYVWFDNSYLPNGTGNYAAVDLNLCGTPSGRILQLLGVARIPVVVTVPYQGQNISTTGFLNWYGNPTGSITPGPMPTSWASAYYDLPGGWNWTLAPVGPAAFPINPDEPLPSLLAFSRSGC